MKDVEHELNDLQRRVVDMGNLSEMMVREAIDGISPPRDQTLFDQLAEDEDRLDQLQVQIDREVVRLLTLYRPSRADLRFVLSVSQINTELERIGDNAIHICEAVRLMSLKTDTPPLPHIQQMAVAARDMVGEVLNAFVQHDSGQAHAAIVNGSLVSALMDQIVGELLSDNVVREAIADHRDIAWESGQLLIARALQRIGDHGTKIGEEVVHMVRTREIPPTNGRPQKPRRPSVRLAACASIA